MTLLTSCPANVKIKASVWRIVEINYAIADGWYNLLFPDKTGINNVMKAKKLDFQLRFSFRGESG